MPCVLNRHHFKGEGVPRPAVYVGRYMLSTLDDHLLDGTALGNPYPLRGEASDEEREECLEQYKKWLWSKMTARDEAVMAAMRLIDEESYIVCSCTPKRCHGHVIEKAWEWLVKEGRLDA